MTGCPAQQAGVLDLEAAVLLTGDPPSLLPDWAQLDSDVALTIGKQRLTRQLLEHAEALDLQAPTYQGAAWLTRAASSYHDTC